MKTQSQNTKEMTMVRGSVRRPNWICRNTKQNVIFVRDKSGSMSGQKANHASAASLDLVAELAESANKDGFNIAVVDFASRANIVHNLEKATELNGKIASLSVSLSESGTNITAGLENAISILEKDARHKQENVAYLRPVVIAFTDGCHNEGPDPQSVANRLKRIADLVTVAFGTDADEMSMRSLASTPEHFYRCTTGRELRIFLAAVGATMTGTMAAGKNATQALRSIEQ